MNTMLPPVVSSKLRLIAQQLAELALDPSLEKYHGPNGPSDKMTEFGSKTEFGNCIVEIMVKPRN